MGLDLEPAYVTALEARTEGWAAGLQLAALSARGRTGAGRHRGRLHRCVHRQPPVRPRLPARGGAAQPARRGPRVPSRHLGPQQLTAPLCDAVTGRPGGQQMLEALERSNLFLVPLDDQRQWFRYHHLFADALRAQLAASDPERLARLHRAAADWYAGQGRLADAIGHALAAATPDTPPTSSSSPARASAGTGTTERCATGWTRCPTTSVRRRPLLATFLAGRACRKVTSTGPTPGSTPPNAPWTLGRSASRHPGRARRNRLGASAARARAQEVRVLPGHDRGLPRLSCASPRRRRRHHRPRPARLRAGRAGGPPGPQRRCRVPGPGGLGRR